MLWRHSPHHSATQSSHSVDLAGWQAKMAAIEFWIPWRDAHRPFGETWLVRTPKGKEKEYVL